MNSDVNEEKGLRARIHDFFETPESVPAKAAQFVIFALIIASAVIPCIEYTHRAFAEGHRGILHMAEWVVLVFFTVEYLLRIFTAPKGGKLRFAIRPLNIIDFLAVFPNYMEMLLLSTGAIHSMHSTMAIRVLRLLRLLRFLRMLRLVRAFSIVFWFFKDVFRYQRTVLQAILPVIIMFMGGKLVVFCLEYKGLWFKDPNLEELFALIGFALGIILSQKIQASYSKFQVTEETVIKISATLQSLMAMLNLIEPGAGSAACLKWAKVFRHAMNKADILPNENNRQHLRRVIRDDSKTMAEVNEELYGAVKRAEAAPADLANMYTDIMRDSGFCLNRKVRYTPRAYDTMLHQATCLYLLMMVLFIPGWAGIVSTLIATYVLYGMYYLTQDFDSITGGDFSLININFFALDQFIESVAKKN